MSSIPTDKYFTHLPPLNKADDFNFFWRQAHIDTKRVSYEPILKKSTKHSTKQFQVFNLHYSGCDKTQIVGRIYIPKKKEKSKVIVYVHDYNQDYNKPFKLNNNNYAYLFLSLRGHHFIKEQPELEDRKTPGFMTENILDKDTYYIKFLYFDVYRGIEMLRLIPQLDCSSIAVIGKGLGAAAAIFAATLSKRVKALVLESPSFCELQRSQNLSQSDLAKEINAFIPHRKDKKKILKENLAYFDALNFSEKITCPVLTVVGLKDKIAPPICAFGLFNHILTEKTMEIYPEEGNDAGGEFQFKKSVKWISKQLEKK